MSVSVEPRKPTIVYDGDCRFCIRRIRDIQRWDSENQFDYLPRQNPQAEQQFPKIKGIELDDGLLLVEPDQNIFIAADACYHIAQRLPLWRTISWLYPIPGIHQVCKLCYRFVANNRKRLGQVCHQGSCSLPSDSSNS